MTKTEQQEATAARKAAVKTILTTKPPTAKEVWYQLRNQGIEASYPTVITDLRKLGVVMVRKKGIVYDNQA